MKNVFYNLSSFICLLFLIHPSLIAQQRGWQNTGLTNTSVFSFSVNDSEIFAGTSAGIYHSTDNGSNWTTFNSALYYA